MKRFFIFLILLAIISCSSQRKITRQFVGKSIAEVEAQLGQPKTVFDRAEGKVYVFEKTEELRSTEINQAKLTLDPMVTPSVTKTERYYVTVKNDVVTKIELENEYER